MCPLVLCRLLHCKFTHAFCLEFSAVNVSVFRSVTAGDEMYGQSDAFINIFKDRYFSAQLTH